MPGKPGKDETAAPTVTGKIIIPAQTPVFTNATAHVRLEDVSYVDTASELIAEAVIPGVRHPPAGAGAAAGDTVLAFTLEVPPDQAERIEPNNDYAVRVWLDIDGDSKAGPGDLHSEESYRVFIGAPGQNLTIMVRPR